MRLLFTDKEWPSIRFDFAAEKITEGISLVAKQTVPAAVASVHAVRKAMGVSTPVPPAVNTSVNAKQHDLESELSKLLDEDEVMAGIFH